MPKVRLADGTVVDVTAADLFADDGTTPFVPPTPIQTAGPFTGLSPEDIEQARREDQARFESHQQTIEGLNERVGTLTAAEQQRLDAAQAEQDRIAEQERQAREAEMDPTARLEAQMAQQREQWQAELNQVSSQFETERALRAKEAEFNALRDYTSAAVAAHTEGENADIAPEFLPFINGNTQEEVDASIARAVEATASITNQIQALVPPQMQQEQFQQFPQQQAPVAPPTFVGSRAWGAPALDPASQQTQQYTPEQLANMSMSEYAKNRPALLGAAATAQRNRGLYG